LIDLVVFDLDGTLVDSGQDLTTGVNRMLGWCGAPPLPEQAVVGMVGDGASVLVRRALEAAGVDPGYPGAYERFLAAYDECLLECTRPYKGIPEALAQVGTGRRLAVLTNKPTGVRGYSTSSAKPAYDGAGRRLPHRPRNRPSRRHGHLPDGRLPLR
jgi:phosphoglycolate phosphatase-like HAD superfamily hydrolase